MGVSRLFNVPYTRLNAKNEGEVCITTNQVVFATETESGGTKIFYCPFDQADLAVIETDLTPTQTLALIDATGHTENGVITATFTKIKGQVQSPAVEGLLNTQRIAYATHITGGGTKLQLHWEDKRYANNKLFEVEEDLCPTAGGGY